MSVRNLDAIFRPKSVALIGAGSRPHSVGAVTAHNLMEAGFDGPIMPVNPHHRSIEGVLAYPDIASLPVVPDLAVICTPSETIPPLIAELGQRGTRGVIVISAGFRELATDQGRALERQLLEAAKPHLVRIVGPNCVGIISTPASLNASFARGAATKGGVAFVAQSGAMVTTVLDWATARGIGFSHLVSLGNMADVDFGDMLDYLASDPDTTAILLYIEAVTQKRKFMSAARAAARLKPVIAIKSGRNAAAARAAASHTGALAGADGVYDAAFRRAGIVRVNELDELFDAVETLAMRQHLDGDRLAIVTNGGGAGVLATDALVAQGGQLATLDPETLAKLDAVLPRTWSHGNPVDIIGDADGARYAAALNAVAGDNGVDAILVLNCPTAIASGEEAATAVIAAAHAQTRPVLTNWLGAVSATAPRAMFETAGISTYETPEKAVRGFMHLARYHEGQRLLAEVPPSTAPDFVPDAARARDIVKGGLASGEPWLDLIALQDLFDCYGIPVIRSARASDPADAADKAKAFAGPVVLKILSRDITHKSDMGGVVLNLAGAASVKEAAETMLARIAAAAPKARIDGFILQEMIRRPGAYELILGMAVDATFGPFILFGHGGTAVEVIGDKALALPPLNLLLAQEMIAHTRISRQLAGYRDRPAVALDQIASALVRLSQLVVDHDAIVELDINPLLADENGVIALDARVKLVPAAMGDGARLAIRPYPRELEQAEEIAGAGKFRLRPVRPEDAPAFVAFFGKLTPEDVRMRFFASSPALPEQLLIRLTQIDYDREMAFVLFDAGDQIAAVARIAADPDNRKAEFALVVRSDLKGRGIGFMMMERIVAYARQRGIGELFGDVIAANDRMLTLCRRLGFQVAPAPAADIVRVTYAL